MKKYCVLILSLILLITLIVWLSCNLNQNIDPSLNQSFDPLESNKAVGGTIIPIVADDYEPDNSFDTAKYHLSLNTGYTFYPLGDVDYVKFDALEGTIYDIYTSPNYDTELTLYNSGKMQIAYNNNDSTISEETVSSRIIWTCPSSGMYYVKANLYSNPQIVRYGLGITYQNVLPAYPDNYEPNDSTASATLMSQSCSFDASLHNSSDIDYYTYYIAGDASASSAYEFGFTTVESGINFSFFASDNSTPILSANIAAGTSKTLYWPCFDQNENKTYYVKINSSTNFVPCNYQFAFKCNYGVVDYAEPNDTIDAATTLEVATPDYNLTYEYTYYSPDDVDWLKFPAAAGKIYNIKYTQFVPALFVMYASDKQTVIANSISSSGIEWQCPASGYYYFKLKMQTEGLSVVYDYGNYKFQVMLEE